MKLPFEIGQLVKRSNIHDLYGGNRQSGISVSANFPFIFIFSSSTGHQHGYKDQWENDAVFSYTGEGQVGDMRFEKGNLALLDHLKVGRRIFLFVYEIKGFVRFQSELELIDYDYFEGNDREGNPRIAIKFFFKKVGTQVRYLNELKALTVEEPTNLYARDIPNETERQGLVKSRIGQGAYRKSVLHRWNFKCAVTGYFKHDILIASHIVPWKSSTNEERLDVHNGILLSPTYDALFDQHLISFENNGKIILSKSLLGTNYAKIGVTGKEAINNLSVENHAYLERHRDKLIQ